MTNRFLILINILVTIGATLVILKGIRRASHNIRMEILLMSEALLAAAALVSEKVDAVGTALTTETAQIHAAIEALQQPDPDIPAAIASLQATAERLGGVATDISNIIPDPAPVEPPAEETPETV